MNRTKDNSVTKESQQNIALLVKEDHDIGGAGAGELATNEAQGLAPGNPNYNLRYLCQHAAHLRAWFVDHEAILKKVEGLHFDRIYDHFIHASSAARTVARAAGLIIDFDSINDQDWDYDRWAFWESPAVGPIAPYTYTGGDVGLGQDPALVTVNFKERDRNYKAGLEWALFNISMFNEPSKFRLLIDTAAQFGIAYVAMIGPLPPATRTKREAKAIKEAGDA